METEAFAHSVAGRNHPNEDRYRLLDARVPVVARSGRGFIYAVADGVGGAPKGMAAAQQLCDRLIGFYRREDIPPTAGGLHGLLVEISLEIHGWGRMSGTNRPLGAAAATVAWLSPEGTVTLFHVGDTTAVLFDGARARWLTREHCAGRALINHYGLGPAMWVERIPVVGLEVGDQLCLVSDGVTRVCTPGHVVEALGGCRGGAVGARRLVQAARNRGSRDDATALVVEILDLEPVL